MRILEVFANQIDLDIPHHTTIRLWVIRYGCYSLQIPLDQADDWLSVGDITVSVGKTKCLVVLGVRMKHLESSENLILTHADVEVLGLYPTEKSTGEFVKEAFEDSVKRIGGNFLAFILDQGSDIKKGAKLFQQTHPDVKILHDIAHKLSNVVEFELKNDEKWSEYIQQLNMTRKRVYQTELAALMPKKQREKARFMDIGHDVHWPERIKNSKANGYLDCISEERFKDYLGWMEGFTLSLDEWGFIENVGEFIKSTIRTNGLSIDVYNYIQMFLDEVAIEGERLQKFCSRVLHAVWEEVVKLDVGQMLICSTEIIESIFGKYKAINEGLHGITSNILGICTFVGRKKTISEIVEAMEKCSVKSAAAFIRQKFGATIDYLRKKFFPTKKRTKFDF